VKHLFKTILLSLSLLTTNSVLAESAAESITTKYPGYLQGKAMCGDNWMPGMVCKLMTKGYTIEKPQLFVVCDLKTNINLNGKPCTREERNSSLPNS
jgi:hypothetical protein